jgi:hypothetical protein
MRYQFVYAALAGILSAVTPLAAQTTTPPTFLSASSTGMMGLAATQTAQLNVVNLAGASTTLPVAACEVQLEFWDATGKMVKSTTITNLAPGIAGLLQIKLGDVTSSASTLRTEVRGVVRSNPLNTSGSGGTLLPIVYPLGCSVATTLEVFDNSTGVAQSLTSDMHALQTLIIPLPAMPGR